MIEAWLSASETIRSSSPVIVGMTPVFAVKPLWNVRTASVPLNSARSRSSSSWRSIVPAIVRAEPRVVGQPQVVVRGEADHLAAVDDHERALGRRHHPERAIEVLLTEVRQL